MHSTKIITEDMSAALFIYSYNIIAIIILEVMDMLMA